MSSDQQVRGQSFSPCSTVGYGNYEFLGEGAYGMVVKASHARHPEEFYAIKKISSFEHQTYCQRTLREIKILLSFEHENIIQVKDVVREELANTDDMREIYLIQECIGVAVILDFFLMPDDAYCATQA